MYIFFNLGNNYSRGENMKMKRVKPLLVPMIYGVCVIAFLFCMYFAGRLSNDLLFKDKKNTNYVDGEIVSEYDKDIPVVSTSSKIVRPIWIVRFLFTRLFMIIKVKLIIRKNLLFFMKIPICKTLG